MYNTETKYDTTDALSVIEPQPVWMTLGEARERAFTGEIVFEVDPEVLAYFDNGVVYYAERASDMPLGRRLLEAGVVDTTQLERGTVRVGDLEHLGRLFDRDDSVDRDAVLVVTETATEQLIAELANQAITTVRATAYRHHPSGVHRWFVVPLNSMAPLRPVVPIDQLVVEELPGLGLLPDTDVAELTIEWDDNVEPRADRRNGEIDLMLFDPFREPDVADSADAAGFEFQVIWPDGTEEATPVEAETETEAADTPAFTETDDGELHFEMPPLELPDDDQTDDDTADDVPDDVPDDVAAAVRRAIAAIELASVSSTPASMASPTENDVVIDTFNDDFERDVDPQELITTQLPTTEPAEAPLSAFAPPTMATRAEVMYAQAAEADAINAEAAPGGSVADPSIVDQWAAAQATADQSVAGEPFLPTPGSSQSPHGVASVVFVDEPAASGDGGDERSSALRRLIGSLRRQDH